MTQNLKYQVYYLTGAADAAAPLAALQSPCDVLPASRGSQLGLASPALCAGGGVISNPNILTMPTPRAGETNALPGGAFRMPCTKMDKNTSRMPCPTARCRQPRCAGTPGAPPAASAASHASAARAMLAALVSGIAGKPRSSSSHHTSRVRLLYDPCRPQACCAGLDRPRRPWESL